MASTRTKEEQQKLNQKFLNAIRRSYGYSSSITDALKEGADIDARDGGGNTAIHRMAENRYQAYRETLKELLERGAQADLQNRAGDTPLHRAAYAKHREAVDILLAV